MPRRLQKLVTMVLLSWAIADLAIPGICQTDIKILPGFGGTSVAMSVDNPSDGARQQPADGEDDCFCCCSHVMAAAPCAVAVGLTSQIVHLRSLTLPPSIAPTPPHQPPRF